MHAFYAVTNVIWVQTAPPDVVDHKVGVRQKQPHLHVDEWRLHHDAQSHTWTMAAEQYASTNTALMGVCPTPSSRTMNRNSSDVGATRQNSAIPAWK